MPLVELGTSWLVNKDYHRGECVLEYAICQGCRDEVTARLSEPSKLAVRKFLESEIDWEERIAEFMECENPLDRLRACVSCSTPAAECDGFAISALFDEGGELVTGPLPLLLCRDCVNRIMAQVSDETKGVWNEFLAECFEGPHTDPGLGGFGVF